MKNQYNLPKRKPFKHPGRLYLTGHAVPRNSEGIEAYTNFLRSEAHAGNHGEVRLRAIRWHFGIKRDFLDLPADMAMSGFADHERGLIFVNKNDSRERQRFTEAHEFIELLYLACQESNHWRESVFAVQPSNKERLCQEGAGALLMPREAFIFNMNNRGTSLRFASAMAKLFKTSFTAAVHRMVNLSTKNCCMLLWYAMPSLRLRWAVCSPSIRMQPAQITYPPDSVIQRANYESEICCSEETLSLDGVPGRWVVEAKRVVFAGEAHILSLIQE